MNSKVQFVLLTTAVILIFATSRARPQDGGYALQFDGANNYVSVPHSADVNFTPTSPMTVEAWVYRMVASADPTE